MASLTSHAEKMAISATELPSFPINLEDVKRTVGDILSQFGKNLIFREYTTHDISHVNDMLATVNWLIPEKTQACLYKAEWLMIVLSIYFHDMGLVVTEDEYQKRSASGFRAFCEEKLFSSPMGADYRSKVNALPDDQRERFLYQEFVRYNHARRVKSWIEGRPSLELGYASAQIGELSRMLGGLDSDFRKDLGLVCESHNLDDLHDIEKYRVSYPYGSSDDETVNLQFCAAVLRTVDLIQITRRRTPSVLYRLIDPSDPVSQAEWAKQAAVRNVRAKVAVDESGIASATLPRHTIEVFATFTEDDAYFGLTSYLRYASAQIMSTHEILQKTTRHTPRSYEFPWQHVDDANVQVEYALKRPFGFEIDQEKILDLLTGHTLYNDSTVVVRELMQNAIDAVRLQAHLDKQDSSLSGKVDVIWDSKKLELTIVDNGTGMTQEIVEKHLLKVGSSRYQDPDFKDKYSDFNPISRFGIGVLSSFMVADSVEIVTVSPEEEKARRISLRSVHGKYLIRLLEKRSDPATSNLGSHGTSIRLRFRPSAKTIDVAETLRRWILFPRCRITVVTDHSEPEKIGFASPKDALTKFVTDSNFGYSGEGRVKVEERSVNGITVAYGLQFSPHFRDWSFIVVPQNNRVSSQQEQTVSSTCIEGIAVEFQTPGYKGGELLVIANATGRHAPRTNVARSAIEATNEKAEFASVVYSILFDAVSSEAHRLRAEEAYSLTWSTEQIPYLIAPAAGPRIRVQYPARHQAALERVSMFLIETEDKRTEKSLADLISLGSFWTVESVLLRSVEDFVREAKAEVTARSLIQVSQGTSSSLPDGPILTNLRGSEVPRGLINKRFEVAHLTANLSERRLDLMWQPSADRWLSRDALIQTLSRSGSREVGIGLDLLTNRSRRRSPNTFFPASESITTTGLEGYIAVLVYDSLYLLPDSPVSKIFGSTDATRESMDSLMSMLVIVEALAQGIAHQRVVNPSSVERFFKQLEGRLPDKWLAGQTRP